MKAYTEKKTIEVTYERLMLDDGFVFQNPSCVLGLMKELERDGFFNTITVYYMDKEEIKKLEEIGVIRKGMSSSYYLQGENYKSFYKELYKTICNEDICL